jgi:Tol biopolymer transport system component
MPKEVEIFVDGKFVKKTDFFFGSALIENLLPKKHKVDIKKDGYFSWEKELEVEERKATEIKNLILFPKNLKISPLSKNVEDFWFSPDGKKIILKEKEDEKWGLKLYSTENKVKSHLLEEDDISKESVEILNLKFSENSDKIEFEAKVGKEEKKFLLDLTKPSQIREIEKIKIPENIVCYQIKNGSTYFLENSGFFFKGNLNFSDKEKLNEVPISVEKECRVEIWNNFVFLIGNENIFLLNSESKSFEKILDGGSGLKISPDSKKIALFSKSEIWLFKENGERIFLNRFSDKIEDLFWLNENYLIFKIQNKIKISEIDTRDKINVIDLLESNGTKFFFNQADKKIYILENGILYQSENIL